MGQFNSHILLQNRRIQNSKDDVTPVMGDGYCPFYDAALVGDWTRLVQLCEGAASAAEDNDDNMKEFGEEHYSMNVILGRMLRQFQKEKGRGPNSSELLDMRKKLADRLGVEIPDFDMDDIKDRCNDNLEDEEPLSEKRRDKKVVLVVEDNENGAGKKPCVDQESISNKEGSPNGESPPQVVVEIPNGNHDPNDENKSVSSEEEQQQKPQPFTFFIDAKGNTPLHVACRRDPPLHAIRAILSMHPPSVWKQTKDGWIPLHLACHCGCDVDVANEILNVMEDSFDEYQKGKGSDADVNDSLQSREGEKMVDRLLPRDVRGRTPLHLACASSRDPRRRPDLVRLLLLRAENPKKAALAQDWFDVDQRVGLDLALGQLKVLTGNLIIKDEEQIDDAKEIIGAEDDGSTVSDKKISSNGVERRGSFGSITSEKIQGEQSQSQQSQFTNWTSSHSLGRTPLNLIEDDYREELEEALLPGFSIPKAIAACRGEGDAEDITEISDNLEYMYECWAMLSVLMLAAGTEGPVERAKEALGGKIMEDDRPDDHSLYNCNNNGKKTPISPLNTSNGEEPLLLDSFSKPCHVVVQDFQAIHRACQSLGDVCPAQFKELVKKFLQGQVDKRSMGSVSALRNQWESRRGVG